ncbi:hypothetical protein [Massilia sp. UBA6681]|uniref:hypothetical protein n=1 Tax=Massilia sp. UBA6681 TaxID=1946839 RepID=UPI0025BB0B5A|nr:hypothetical protein [Massilia sp. UBA6681]
MSEPALETSEYPARHTPGLAHRPGLPGCPELVCAQAAEVTITADRLLDVRTGRMVQNPEILVRGGRIVSVKPASATPAAAPGKAGTRIALPGMTV